MPVNIEPCDTPDRLKKFVRFPYDLYSMERNWIPPLRKQELNSLMISTNPALKDCTTQFWIAYYNGKVAGRIGVIINPKYNTKKIIVCTVTL